MTGPWGRRSHFMKVLGDSRNRNIMHSHLSQQNDCKITLQGTLTTTNPVIWSNFALLKRYKLQDQPHITRLISNLDKFSFLVKQHAHTVALIFKRHSRNKTYPPDDRKEALFADKFSVSSSLNSLTTSRKNMGGGRNLHLTNIVDGKKKTHTSIFVGYHNTENAHLWYQKCWHGLRCQYTSSQTHAVRMQNAQRGNDCLLRHLYKHLSQKGQDPCLWLLIHTIIQIIINNPGKNKHMGEKLKKKKNHHSKVIK